MKKWPWKEIFSFVSGLMLLSGPIELALGAYSPALCSLAMAIYFAIRASSEK